MAVSVKTMRQIAGTAGLLSLVCFCMDCFRASRASASSGYFAAVFIADIWGFIPYTVKTLGKENYFAGGGAVPVAHNRTHQIAWRLTFFVLALIAPCIELVNAGFLNSHMKNMTSTYGLPSWANGVILDKMSEDVIAACWGALGDALRFSAKFSVVGDTVASTCGALQARTVIMLIISVLVLVEMILYAQSNVGTEAWVQEQLEKTPSTTVAVGGAETTIEMTSPVYPVAYPTITHPSPAPFHPSPAPFYPSPAPSHPSPIPHTPSSPYTPPTVV